MALAPGAAARPAGRPGRRDAEPAADQPCRRRAPDDGPHAALRALGRLRRRRPRAPLPGPVRAAGARVDDRAPPTAQGLPARRDAEPAAAAARHADVRGQPGAARPGRGDRVRRPAALRARRPGAAHQLARDRQARRAVGDRDASGAELGRRHLPRHLPRGEARGREHARPGGGRRRGAGAPLPRREGPRRPRRLRRRAQLADGLERRRPALPRARLAPRRGDLPQLRVEGHRPAARSDAAAEGARARALAAPRRTGGAGAARPARPRVRPRGDRDLAGALRGSARRAARRPRVAALAAAPRGRFARATCGWAFRSSSGAPARPCRRRWRR